MFSHTIKDRDGAIGMQAGEEDLSLMPKLDLYEYSGGYRQTEAIKISIKNGSIFLFQVSELPKTGTANAVQLFK